jgi:hypothetical protein
MCAPAGERRDMSLQAGAASCSRRRSIVRPQGELPAPCLPFQAPVDGWGLLHAKFCCLQACALAHVKRR